jgi:inner membrane protein involved in colicin E2 resistance
LAGLRVKVAFIVSLREDEITPTSNWLHPEFKGIIFPAKGEGSQKSLGTFLELSALKGTDFTGCGKLVQC